MTAMNYKLLNFVKLKEVRLWDVKRYFDATLNKKEGYLELSDVLKPFKVAISHREVRKQNMQIISKINFAGNLFLRDFNEIDTYKGSLFLVPKGTIIFSKINARHGCIYYNNSSPFVVSSEYPVFKIDETKAYGNYLHYALRLDPVKNHLNSKVTGIAKSRLSLSEFLKLPIPIPPLAAQEKILNAFLSYNSQAQKAENQANELEKNIEDYLLSELGIEKPKAVEKKEGLQFVRFKDLSRWDYGYVMDDEKDVFTVLKETKYPISALGQIYKFINRPWSNKKHKNKTFRYVEIGSVDSTLGIIDYSEIETDKAPSRATQIIKENDLIIGLTRPNLRKFALVSNKYNDYVCSSGFQIISPSDNHNLVFLLEFLKSEVGVKQISFFMAGAIYPAITSKQLKNLQIPLPPKDIQDRIANHITAIKEKTKSLRQQAEELRKRAKETFENEIFV